MPKTGTRSAVATPHCDYNMSETMAQIMTTQNMVIVALTQEPRTRSSDRLLVSYIYRVFYGVGEEPFYKVMEEYTHLSSFETISRCRRKLQEKYEELRAVEQVENNRINRQIDFIEYAAM